MKITPKQYAIALYESTKNVSMDELDQRVKNFVRILKKNNDFPLADNIIKQYSQYYREKKNISKIEITTPDKLSQEELNSILKKVSKQIEVEEKVDKSLIGGIVIKINGNILIDGSVKRKLIDLKKNLT